MNPQTGQNDTGAWIFFAWASFIIATGTMFFGIYHAPIDLWIKGFFAMGTLFIIGSTFTLGKTIRDNAEAIKRIQRMTEPKIEPMVNNYEMRKV